MSARIRGSVLGVSLLVVLYVVIGALLGQTAGEGAYKQLAVFSEVLSRIRSDYVEAPNLDRVTRGALHGLLEALDPYSSYLSPREFDEYKAKHDQAEGDVGLVLSKRFGMFIVISTLPDSPAARAELLTGDMLESVAGFSSRGMSIEQARLLLVGEPGTGVTLSVVRQRRTEPFQLELIRARVRPTEVVSTTLEDNIAYLKVASFTPGKAEEIGRALIRLEAAGARKLILDLRWCASGEAEEGIETARLLLEDGSVGYLQGQQYSRQDFPAHPDQTLWRGPVSVLINVGTAGPAELLAAAVLDNQRGEVIGERSYGVGALQKLIPLDDGAALILSVAKYYRPSGEAIQGNAVTPSIAIERPDGEEALRPLRHAPPAPGDPVVLKALDVLRAASAEQPAKKAA